MLHRIIFILSIVFIFSSCGKEETINPLYPAKNIQQDLQNITFNLDASIGQSKIEVSGIRKITRTLVGWIPGYGFLAELPMNFVGALLPALPSISHPELPKDGQWTDPAVLNSMNAIRIKGGYIRIVPKEDRENFACRVWYRFWDKFRCPEVEIKDFISSINVYMTFTDIKLRSEEDTELDAKKEILIAWTRTEDLQNYDREKQILHFNTASRINFKEYLDKYGNIDIRVEVKGWYPNFETVIDGKVNVELELRLKNSESTTNLESTEDR